MEIRKRLTLQFTIIVAIILFLAELVIFLFLQAKWKEDFFNRLQTKASAVTKLLLDVEGIDANILRLIEKNNLSTLPFEEIHIYDQRDNVVFISRDSTHLVITNTLLDRVREDVTPTAFYQGKYTVVGFQYPINKQIVIIAGAIDIYGLRKLNNLRNILVIVFLTSLIILYFSGRLFSNRALQPILQVINEVPAITESSLNFRVNEGNGTDEIARLAKTFNLMLDRLEGAFKEQRNFIANASHEIRTPLAHMGGQIEVTLLKERPKQEYITLLQSILEDIIKMGNTANRLLLLTMANPDIHPIPMKIIRVDELLWETKATVNKTHPDYKINIRFQGKFETEHLLIIKGNDQLLQTAFLNLMENGCKYSANKEVQVTLKHPGHIEITFSDQGIGIPLEEQEFLFEPFYRAKNVTTIPGSGLGLSLVKRIALVHGGSISVVSTPGKGSDFILTFPTVNM